MGLKSVSPLTNTIPNGVAKSPRAEGTDIKAAETKPALWFQFYHLDGSVCKGFADADTDLIVLSASGSAKQI